MTYIITKAPIEADLSIAEARDFIAELIAEERGVDLKLAHVATLADAEWNTFIFRIAGGELSECDDMLSELIDLPEGLADDFATQV